MTREDAQSAWVKIVDVAFSDYNQLSTDQKVWFSVEPLIMGGIVDHYINHGADHNQDVLRSLEFLGFRDIAVQMLKINQLFTNGQPPEDILERNQEWDSWSEEHEELFDEVENNFWTKRDDIEMALMEHINRTGIGII